MSDQEVYQKILKHYSLSPEVCRQKVSDDHLDKISRSYCEHWRDLETCLDLGPSMVKDIKRMQGDEAEKRREIFFGWKKRKGFDATYERLIRALLKIDCRQDAESICELLQESTQGQDHVGGEQFVWEYMPFSPPCRLVPLQTIV